MATWAKFKFFWDKMLGSAGSTLTASDTAAGYSVADIYNMFDTNLWLAANTTTPKYITYDAGVGNTKQANYLILYLTNLATIGATVTLQHSTDNFSTDINDAFTGEAVTSDILYIKRFTNPGGKRYWRLNITGTLSAAPYITLGIWGLETELDYCSASFDPHAQETKANITISEGGYVTGIHEKYTERQLSLRIEDADAALYNKIKAWWEGSGLNQFFISWDYTNNPTEVWLMRPDTKFNNPFKAGGLYRDISINLTGRKVA